MSPDGGVNCLDTVGAEEYTGIPRRTLEGLRVRGGGPRFVKVGAGRSGRVLYRVSDLDAFLESRVCCSTSDYGALHADR